MPIYLKANDGQMIKRRAVFERYQALLERQKRGDIKNLSYRRPVFMLQESFSHDGVTEQAITFQPDVSYFDLNAGRTVFEIIRPKRGGVYSLKFKMMKKMYPNYKYNFITSNKACENES